MGSKNKKKENARKRKISDQDLKKIEIDKPRKKRPVPESKQEEPVTSTDVKLSLLPTRHAQAEQLLVSTKHKQLAVIEGSIGCGKTFLVRYLAQQMELPLNVMQMGDQVDSKTLFGSYHCTEVAGQFKWKPSNFSQWLLEPCVILLEDIDMANPDVISAFVELASERNITLPSGETVSFHEKVRLVATISGKGKRSSVLDGVPVRICLEPLTDGELKRLVTEGFPRCAHLAKTLTKIFRAVEAVPTSANSRPLTSTDLLRGCARINNLVDLSSNVTIFTELVDVWCLSDQPERSRILCEKVASHLTITMDQLSFHLSMRQPTISHDDVSFTVGRCKLPRSPTLKIADKHKLGHTTDVLQLMERLAVCVKSKESVLLVGETGVGKTSVVQTLASSLNVQLKVVNLSPTSDSDELIQGYKPTTVAHILEPFTKFYHEVFTSNFDAEKNQKFLSHLETCLSSGRYRDYLTVVESTAKKGLATKDSKKGALWSEVLVRSRRIRDGLEKNAAPFAITRGAVLEAAQEGHWLLIDEINLAPPECLDAIVHAISTSAHPDFRLFACMNPATDAGKRRLPTGVRTKFTEFYVSEVVDQHQLALVVSAYLPTMKSTAVENLVNFYLQAKQQFPGSYSLRTLCRALLFAGDNIFGSEDRSLYEAICMAFLTNLGIEDKAKMQLKIKQTFKVATHILIPPPSQVENYVQVEGYWIERGTELPKEDKNYVVTQTVKANLAEIGRIVCSGRFPVLLEGETSAGKTSIVCHLARVTGNRVVRINNHEHTDVQEYMGSYVADESGRLVFREGALVKAVREGSWVILDELNLAPTDVIEALNRLLDDNRELFVPELNQTIRAHPRFRLFATQNPAGTYAGRKRLSRALLSRFIVLRFHHLPLDELSAMVCTRCGIHASAATKMIAVLSDLRVKRSLSGLFSARDGLMTLRDVFRWAKRLATDETCDDWLQILANHGYFLLAGRCRNKKDEATVVETLERILKRKIDIESLFSATSAYFPKDVVTKNVIMTTGMRRMLVMTHQAWLRDESVLMVGETGGGKTSLAEVMGRGRLLTINCHERTETADLLGRLRPKEGGGFEWSDGIVITAMRTGAPLLVDEISLAEDSVLERLNPLFEEDRSLLLSDAGVEVHSVSADSGYKMIATMNPGGDYGKKELSKALRNRFTEVWSSNDYESSELISIFDSRLDRHPDVSRQIGEDRPSEAGRVAVSWIGAFFHKYSHVFRNAASVRDVVACADLFAAGLSHSLDMASSLREALSAVFLDSLSSLPTRMNVDIEKVLKEADKMLSDLLKLPLDTSDAASRVVRGANCLIIGALSIPHGTLQPVTPKAFSLKSPTCVSNFYRIARGLLINKPILMEGAPGCGKSSTVMALAELTGHPITRLNLSDQTDLSDLFGSDVPVVLPDGTISFRWEDGPVLQAIKRGEWVLLDEMNLASQSVLEGLNACFDHRRILYIAELNKSFEIPADSRCRFFACQNPRAQGGNRRALPKSFINRFTNIWVNDLTTTDIAFILKEVDTKNILSEEQIAKMVHLNAALSSMEHLVGGPFSFNLRDLLRWLKLYSETSDMAAAYELLYVSRMRRDEDREKLRELYEQQFGEECIHPAVELTADERELRIGQVSLPRTVSVRPSGLRLLSSQTTLLHHLVTCVKHNWLPLLIGPRNCGKRAVVENLASSLGCTLQKIVLNSETDAQELIGSYEQLVDESAVENAKAVISEQLLGKVGDCVLKKVRYAEDLLQLEVATELALSLVSPDHKATIEECRDALEMASRNDMRFAWVDSPFVRAFVEGHWLLIEDVNLCSGAVLDRLNSCLENDGKLVISERQSSFEPLEPHPNFRVFLSMDARNGEVSRAMRNRSVEMYLDEHQKWNTSIEDVISMAADEGRVLGRKTAASLLELPVEKQLQFLILLRDMSIEEACRSIGIEYVEKIKEEGGMIVAPRTGELGTESYATWLVQSWTPSGDSPFNRLLLCLLDVTPQMVTTGSVGKMFGETATSFLARLKGLLDVSSGASHPIDARFSNRGRLPGDSEKLKRLVNTIVMEWARCSINNTDVQKESAEDLSRTLTKYEMSTSSSSFKNLQLIAGFVDASLKALKEGTITGEEKEVFAFCFSLMLLVQSCRQQLSGRSGCAPIYLAWNYLKGTAAVKLPSTLNKVMSLLSTGWTAESHEVFVEEYLRLYKGYRLIDPFDSEQENERFLSIADAPLPTEDGEAMDTDEEGPPYVEKRESPIRGAMGLVERMHRIMHFLATQRVDESDAVFLPQKTISALKWREPDVCRFVRVLSLLNTNYQDDDKVLSIPLHGAFSSVYTSFWSSLQFDISMNLLTVEDLRNFAMNTFIRQMWRLAPNSALLTDKLRSERIRSCDGVAGWCNSAENGNGSWQHGVETAVQMMEKALPPPDTLDPVLFEEEETKYLEKKLEIVSQQLDILAERRRIVSRQDADCDAQSCHPVISALFEYRLELSSKLEDRTTTEGPVYRQKACEYSSLCADMRSFRSLSGEVVDQLRCMDDSRLRETDTDALQIMHSRLQSYAISAGSFKQSCLVKFSSFVDVSMTFLTAVDVLLTSIYEVCLQIEAVVRRRDLQKNSAFPIMFSLSPSPDGVESSELLAWCCRDGSPMPIQLKSAVVRERVGRKTDLRVDLEWTRRQWQKWYEKNIAKAAEKEFVYREKTEEEKDELDVIAFFSKEEQDQEILPSGDILLLLDASRNKTDKKSAGSGGVTVSDRAASRVRYSMALTWIRHVLMGLGQFTQDVHDKTIESDLSILRWVNSQESDDTRNAIDVYRSASVREFRRGSELLDALAARTREVMERWPEVATLRLILDSISLFNNASLSTTHMKMATMLENVIEQSEEWEKLADRANSLREPLAPLRELLVDWKKMEVRSWSQLLVRCEADARQRAQLVAYPLFDALFKADSPETLASIVAMCADWLHQASLIDFCARLDSVNCLAEWAHSLEHCRLGDKLRSLAAHFAQYLPLIEGKLKEARDPADHSLADYLKIVKYNDLNLWNIKVSSQKAHTHLFKIIRKFKEAVGFEVAPHFDVLLDIDSWRDVGRISVEIGQVDGQGRTGRAKELVQKTVEEGAQLCDVTELTDLEEQIRSCDEALRTQINYDQYEEDKEKEKAQGYARNCRQRDVAMVIKEAQAVGLNARKAMTLDAETVTQQSITGVAVGRGKEGLVRVCAGGRNACIRTANNANDQLGVSTRKHLSGVVEYGMSWMLKLQSKVASWEDSLKELQKKTAGLERIRDNVQAEWVVDHTQLADTSDFLCEQADQLNSVVKRMKSRLEMVPDSDDDIDASCSSHLHPLSTLHANDSRLEGLRQKVAHVCQLANDVVIYTRRMRDEAKIGVFEKSSVVAAFDQLSVCLEDFDSSVVDLNTWFEKDSQEAKMISAGIASKLKVAVIEASPVEHSTNDALLFIQSLYKSIVEGKEGWTVMKPIERLETAIHMLEGSGLQKLLAWISAILSDASVGLIPSSLSEMCSIAKLCSDLLSYCNGLLSNALQVVGIVYHGILSMAMQLFQKGYVNTIAKDGKMESGTGETDEAGEGGGMGEGKSSNDAKDVTDEMEETGQIEGLQDDEEEPPTGDQGSNEKPIDMDEDFAEDLQDIDREEKGNDNEDDQEDEEEEEPEAEDQMGEVEDEDDKQLDPKLWDEEEKDNDRKDTDQENEAADNKTEELAAKEDETATAEEEKKEEESAEKESEEQEGRDKEEDVENMDEREREEDGKEQQAENEIDEIDQPDDSNEKGDDLNMDEEMADEGESDKEDEETKDGEGNEEQEEEDDQAEEMKEEDATQNPGEEEEEKKEEGEAMEQGTGGERRENEEKEEEGGGMNEDEREEDEQREEEEETGKGESKSDDRGDAGKGTEAKQKEDEEEKEKGEEEENEEGEKERQLGTEEEEMVEDAEEGEGEENESGRMMEDAPAAAKQMVGAGSLEEARQSKKEDRKEERKMRKQPLAGCEEEMEVPAEEGTGDEEMPESTGVIHLAAEDMFSLAEDVTRELVLGDAQDKEETSKPVSTGGLRSDSDAEQMWTHISRSVNILAAELAENLRLILEPQRASKMQGDYRTGKRLNMRRLIPYIASEYRKDRIWMRRTKRAQREYQVLIAVDDSASMNENGIHQVTCESVCSIDDALRRCDAGAVSVCSFGSGVDTICAFGDQMTPGPQLLQKLTFAQSSTDLLALLNTARSQLNEVRTATSEQLLIIISDGRGALAQGAEKVRQAVAGLQGVTVLFVILDSGPKSIAELSVASFQGGSVVLTPYMSLFPFPFYAIVKSVQQLPSVLSESIRQWFELTVQSNM